MDNFKSHTKFIDYCLDFYGEEGVYSEIGASREDIEKAVQIRTYLPFSCPFDADSIDREIVRDIVLMMKGRTPWGFHPDGTWK